MLTITEILDGNIYRVVEENDLSQTGDLTDSSEVTFDTIIWLNLRIRRMSQ
jgi:hypothetical protein